MPRSPYQTLIIPFYKEKDLIKYALFKRKDDSKWQAIAGGGEDGEIPLQTAIRETNEEAGITADKFIELASLATIPVIHISGFRWGEELLVIPEYSFGVEVINQVIEISKEHTEYKWFIFEDAMKVLAWDSNKNALWELDYRLKNNLIDSVKNKDIIYNHYI